MLKIYGSEYCPDCTACEKALDDAHIPYEFINISANKPNLKAFLQLRDTDPHIDKVRERGLVGIPCIIREDGTMTFHYEKVLAEYNAKAPEVHASCSLDGKGC